MALSLKESRACSDMASILSHFLPGSGNASWKGHTSFRTIAANIGVGDYWQSGSKEPMVNALLQRTLEHHRSLFETLILDVVRAGIAYRQKKDSPISEKEIERLNGHLLEVGFK